MTESLGEVRALLESIPDQRPYEPAQVLDDPLAGLSEPPGVPEAVPLVPLPAALTARPPAGVALLSVMRGQGLGEFTLTWNDGRTTQQTINKLPTSGKGSIADIMHVAREAARQATEAEADSLVGGPWQKALSRLIFHWSDLPHLGAWVTRFSASTATPQLVIWDVTGQDIPWELYHSGIGTESSGGGWLGVALPVSRWTGMTPKRLEPGTDRRDVAGPVLLFDDGETHEQQDGLEYLEVYQSISAQRVGEPETSMKGLLRRLEQDDEFGLLMIRGHGHYAEDLETFTLAGLPLLALANTTLKSLDRNHPAILLNVCDSGRTYVDETAPNLPVRGFVEPFIKLGASAVIAIMAQIDTTHLHDTALRLVQSARQDPVSVPEWLRDHRARYLRALDGESGSAAEKEELTRMFLTSSLYVCYCQPGTTLHVTAPQEPATRDGAR